MTKLLGKLFDAGLENMCESETWFIVTISIITAVGLWVSA